MEDKKTSSGSIKTFARIIFVIGVIFTVIMTIGIIGCGIVYGNEIHAAIVIGSIIGGAIFCVVMIFLLAVEKAFLMTYAEMGEDIREVRNILARRDATKS